jgi:hypothetical protein
MKSCRTVDQRLLTFLLDCHRARKQNVVFQMNMLMKIAFEDGQSFIERLVADTSVGRYRVAVGYLVHCTQGVPRCIMFALHHGNRILDRAEGCA